MPPKGSNSEVANFNEDNNQSKKRNDHVGCTKITRASIEAFRGAFPPLPREEIAVAKVAPHLHNSVAQHAPRMWGAIGED